MSPRPTGWLRPSERGTQLIIERSFEADIEDVWMSVTDSASLARWIGPWEGDAGPGKTVRMQMAYEQDAPWADVTIEVCDPPHRLLVITKDAAGTWKLELSLSRRGRSTLLTFVQHDIDAASAGDFGPGWEYYLDRLVAARSGSPLPEFADYYPAQKQHYLDAAQKL
jgi:uncharacterized protein YndB with AHSA1/START domain